MESVNATSGLTQPPTAAGPQRPRDPKLWKAATDFQEIILSQFTQAMRATDNDNDLVEQCPGKDIFDQMFSDAIAHEMSKSGSMGLNKTIYRAMGGTFTQAAGQTAALPGKAPVATPSLGGQKSTAALPNGAPAAASPHPQERGNTPLVETAE